ncbi:YadA-like family protein [Sphingomicrobium clamense]|uniref:YadA-like family protein n=1 Tax=Sphingomicrobium clamense TaxID=2851013 RepID=A0ABS6V890_9SPHN|nr:YadA-like family protein [Sphingomicrobium sp. B8]MBW0145799.1 YadA-like family protein [Sphingomicrobium sp. B8]
MTVSQAHAQALPPADDRTIVSVCSRVSLPPSTITGVLDDVVIGIYDPIETTVNDTLAELTLFDAVLGAALPTPLNVDVTGLLTTAASGSDITLEVLANDGTLVGPSDQCDAEATSFVLADDAGLSLGGNRITGLGESGREALAGEIDSIALGNDASTDASAVASIAIGTGATVGAGADGSVALGEGTSVTAANSVALGADSVASRGAVAGTSVGEVSVGSPGNERQITNVADGTQATDAVNLGQLQAVADMAVQYDDATMTTVTLEGAGRTTITNVADGAVTATSSDAVNGSQLFATNQQVGANTTAITNLSVQVANGGTGPVQYSDPGTPTTPNGGTPTNDVTLVGAAPGPVAVHNVAAGDVSMGSTDAVNGGQLYDVQTTADQALALGQNSVQYTDATQTAVDLGDGTTPVSVTNVADGSITAGSTDAINGGQLYGLSFTTVNAVSYDDDGMGNRTNTVTLQGGDPNAPVTITGLADGVAATDAVNRRQLDAVAAGANSYTDMVLNDLAFDLGEDIRNASRDARAGTAGALAAAALPQSMIEGRPMLSGGFGFYRGRVGFAIGGSYRAANGRSIYKLGVTYDSSESVGANVGAGFQF